VCVKASLYGQSAASKNECLKAKNRSFISLVLQNSDYLILTQFILYFQKKWNKMCIDFGKNKKFGIFRLSQGLSFKNCRHHSNYVLFVSVLSLQGNMRVVPCFPDISLCISV